MVEKWDKKKMMVGVGVRYNKLVFPLLLPTYIIFEPSKHERTCIVPAAGRN